MGKRVMIAISLSLVVAAISVVATRGGIASSAGLVAAENDPRALSVLLAGNAQNVSAITSGKGRVTVSRLTSFDGGETAETTTGYDVVFRGKQFRVSARTVYVRNEASVPPGPGAGAKLSEPGTVARRSFAYDGSTVTLLRPDAASATLGSSETAVGRGVLLEYQGDIAVGSGANPGSGVLSIPDLHQQQLVRGYVGAAPRIVGRQDIDGHECVVVEYVDTLDLDDGGQRRLLSWFWLDPGRGCVPLRFRTWIEGAGVPEKTLGAECSVSVKQYGGSLWGPSQRVSQSYMTGQGTRVKQVQVTVTYDPFEINVPVTDADLALPLPSGTQVHDEVLDADYTVP